MPMPTTKTARTVIHTLFWIALVVALWFAWSPHPPTLINNDKSQHEMAFVVLTGLAALAFPKLKLWKIGLIMALLGAIIELVQAIPFIHRDCDIYDWYADVGATLVALALCWPLRHFNLPWRWMPREDSNLDKRNQNPVSYH